MVNSKYFEIYDFEKPQSQSCFEMNHLELCVIEQDNIYNYMTENA